MSLRARAGAGVRVGDEQTECLTCVCVLSLGPGHRARLCAESRVRAAQGKETTVGCTRRDPPARPAAAPAPQRFCDLGPRRTDHLRLPSHQERHLGAAKCKQGNG